MDILGIGLQEVLIVTIFIFAGAFQINMLRRVWHKDVTIKTKVCWTGVIVILPLVGAAVYYWYNKKKG